MVRTSPTEVILEIYSLKIKIHKKPNDQYCIEQVVIKTSYLIKSTHANNSFQTKTTNQFQNLFIKTFFPGRTKVQTKLVNKTNILLNTKITPSLNNCTNYKTINYSSRSLHLYSHSLHSSRHKQIHINHSVIIHICTR